MDPYKHFSNTYDGIFCRIDLIGYIGCYLLIFDGSGWEARVERSVILKDVIVEGEVLGVGEVI